MLDREILEQIKSYTEKMNKKVFIRLSAGEHESRQELLSMLESFCSVSEKLILEIGTVQLRSGVSFDLKLEDKELGIIFSGIPGGHEFNSFLLAVLNAGGVPIKLDESIQNIIKSIKETLKFETIVSLSCHNCPEVVQALNVMAFLNPNISNEMIEGGLFPEIIEERKILGVPAVYLNGKSFSNGKMDISEILEKLKDFISYTAEEKTEKEIYDIVVIGGGPAGVSSAIYTARKGFKVLMITDRVGGQVRDTMDIENMISMIHTTGPVLSDSLEEHLKKYSIVVRKNIKVEKIIPNKEENFHALISTTKEEILTKSIILSTGAKWRELGVPGEKENLGSGVAYCPHCDGPFFKDKDVIVVGGGNSGIEAALDLSQIVKSVTVLEYSDTLKADKILIDRALDKSNIRIKTSIQSKSIETKNGKVNSLIYLDRNTEKIETLEIDGIFIQIGLVPNTAFIKELIELNKFGEIIIDSHCRTNVKGIFACGDVTNIPYKQIIIAMGEGAKAGLSTFEYLAMGK